MANFDSSPVSNVPVAIFKEDGSLFKESLTEPASGRPGHATFTDVPKHSFAMIASTDVFSEMSSVPTLRTIYDLEPGKSYHFTVHQESRSSAIAQVNVLLPPLRSFPTSATNVYAEIAVGGRKCSKTLVPPSSEPLPVDVSQDCVDEFLLNASMATVTVLAVLKDLDTATSLAYARQNIAIDLNKTTDVSLAAWKVFEKGSTLQLQDPPQGASILSAFVDLFLQKNGKIYALWPVSYGTVQDNSISAEHRYPMGFVEEGRLGSSFIRRIFTSLGDSKGQILSVERIEKSSLLEDSRKLPLRDHVLSADFSATVDDRDPFRPSVSWNAPDSSQYNAALTTAYWYEEASNGLRQYYAWIAAAPQGRGNASLPGKMPRSFNAFRPASDGTHSTKWQGAKVQLVKADWLAEGYESYASSDAPDIFLNTLTIPTPAAMTIVTAYVGQKSAAFFRLLEQKLK